MAFEFGVVVAVGVVDEVGDVKHFFFFHAARRHRRRADADAGGFEDGQGVEGSWFYSAGAGFAETVQQMGDLLQHSPQILHRFAKMMPD